MTDTAPQFVGLGELMIRETPADHERLERTRQVWWTPAGAEFNVAVGIARLGIPSRILTRLPDNPLGRLCRSVAKEHGVCDRFVAHAPAGELVGRMPYDPGVPPRPGAVYYQRKFSAASKLSPEEVDWKSALEEVKIVHTSGITMGLAAHSGYERNYLRECLDAAISAKSADCKISFDFNYRSTLWDRAAAQSALEPILHRSDILIASVEDLASFFGLRCKSVSSEELIARSAEQLPDELLREFSETVVKRFGSSFLVLTRRNDLSSSQATFESIVATREGGFFRSRTLKQFEVVDRIGGGDAWAAGFYYSLLRNGWSSGNIAQALEYGDAAMQLHQTSMFDLPIITLPEVEALVRSGGEGSKRIKR